MDFSSYSEAVIARAAALCSYTKSVSLNADGTLNWWGEETHPTDSEMNAKMSAAQTAFDTQSDSRDDDNGALDAPDE
mgnify:CR=1|tara:strand:+ start:2808 stop:3038 length:231 start_codon:yes stop_codon:yes gene_type:complete